MARCAELEGELAELKAAYEQYFLGNERLPPLKKHEQFKKLLLKVKGAMIRQTAAKFRLESISQKLLTYERLWDRSLKEIEAGTYRRDLARLRRKDQRKTQRKTTSGDAEVDDDLDLSDLDDDDASGDSLEEALKAAEAAVSKPAAPAIPAVAPLVTPAAGAAPVPAIKPLVTPSIPAVAAVARPLATGSTPAVAPVKPVTGTVPAVKPATTGVTPAIAPVKPPTTGSTPAVKPVTGSMPAAAPRVTSGAFPAAQPSTTGSVPVFAAATSNPAMRAVGPGASRPQAAAADSGLSETKIKAIYDAYVMAKKRCGEDTRALTLDSVASSLKKQVPELMKQHNAKSVEFKVVIKDGKAVLRALPKE